MDDLSSIFLIKKCVNWIYLKQYTRLNQKLDSLRAKQRSIIEELKEITAFYRAKELIERYEQVLNVVWIFMF
jgi:hypothetical protein